MGLGETSAQFRGALMPPLSWMVALLLVLLISVLFTWLARGYALRRNLMDHPGERRSHHVVTPRGGGVAIVLSILVAAVAAVVIWPSLLADVGLFSLGLILVAGIGWWDDHRPLPALMRLGVHVLASLLMAALVWRASGSLVHAALALLVTVSLINIWNFMDGINGLAVTQAILAPAACALFLPVPWMLAPLLLAVACLGFLPFNFPRARIFLGDVGSGALGYLIAGLLCLCTIASSVNWLLLLLPIAAFLVDAGATLGKRVITGQNWMQAHTQHLYQRLTKCGFSHVAVTTGYAAYALSGITLAMLLYGRSGLASAVGVVVWFTFSAAAWVFLGKLIGAK